MAKIITRGTDVAKVKTQHRDLTAPVPPWDPLRGLSESEVTFLESYMKHLDAARAYDDAGFTGKQRHTNAYKMLRKPRMQAAIIELQNRLMMNSEITALKVLNDLEDERKGAIEAKQFAAAIKASELQGKHIGMFNDGYADRDAGPMIVILSGGRSDGEGTITIEHPGPGLLSHTPKGK